LFLDFESYTAQYATDNTMNNSLWPTIQPRSDNSNEENVSSMAQLLVKLGVLYWRRGNYDRSEQLLTKAQEISADTKDVQFMAHCFIGLALVKTRLEKIDDAIAAYQQAIRLEPENFHLWNNLGNLYLQHHQPDKAVAAFKQSIHGNSNDAIAWNGLACAHDQSGNVEEAIHAYKRAIETRQDTGLEQPDRLTPELNKHFAAQWFHLAMLYTKKCQYKKAIEAYQKMLRFDAGNAEVWNELGVLYIRMNAHKESIDSLSKAIELNPEYGEACLNLAYAYAKTGKHQESIPFYMKSIEWLPSQRERKLASHLMEEAVRIVKKNNSVEIYAEMDETGMGSSYRDEISWFYFKYNEEITLIDLPCSGYNLKKLTKRTADKVAHKNHSDAIGTPKVQKTKKGEGNMPSLLPPSPARQIQSKSGIMSEHQQDIKTEISDPYVWNEKGNIHFNSQDYEDAIISYNRAIESDPTFGQPFYNLALIYFVQGNYDESIFLYQKSIKLLTTDQEKAIAWNGLGHVYRCIKDYESARFAYQRASELDKKNGGVYDRTILFEVSEEQKTAGFWNDLGKLLFKTGAYNKAASAFQKAIQLEPSSGHAHGYLARALTAQGQYKEAVSLYLKSIDLIPNEKEKANAWNRLGDVHRKLNDYDNALKAYQNATALTNDKVSLLSRTRFSLLSNCATQ